MIFYYLFILLSPFQLHPKLGATLFTLIYVPITPIKLVGAFMVIAALLMAPADNAAPHQGSAIPALFFAFGLLPIFSTALILQEGIAQSTLAAVTSFGLLLVATRMLITTPERMRQAIRVIVVSETIGSLWLYKQTYIWGWDRPIGPSGDPNYAALSLVMVMPLAAWLWRYDTSSWWRRAGLMCLPVLFYGLVLSQSRGAALALCVVAVAAWWRSQHKVGAIVMFAAALAVVVAIAPGQALERIRDIGIDNKPQTGAEYSREERTQLLQAGLRMIERHPLFGVGLEKFSSHAVEYNPMLSGPKIAHNTYVQLAAEGGLWTLGLFLVLPLLAWRYCGQTVRQGGSVDAALVDLARMIRISLAGFAVASFFLTAEFVKELWVLVFLSINLREIVAFEAASKTVAAETVKPAGKSLPPRRMPHSAPRVAAAK